MRAEPWPITCRLRSHRRVPSASPRSRAGQALARDWVQRGRAGKGLVLAGTDKDDKSGKGDPHYHMPIRERGEEALAVHH